jgi:hypothetical protein
MVDMNAKRIARAFAVLLLTYFVFNLIQGKTGLRAMAADEQGMFVPAVEGTWEKKQLHAVERTRSMSNDKKAAEAAAARHRSAASTAGPVRDEAATAAMHKAMPWVAGALGLAGLGLVVCGLLARRRLSRAQVARSMTSLQVSEAGRPNKRAIHPRLASNLARAELPRLVVSVDDHPAEAEEQKLRRAA